LGGLGATYAVQLRLIGKFVADFLFVLTELNFSLGVTAEALRTTLAIGGFEEMGQFRPNFT